MAIFVLTLWRRQTKNSPICAKIVQLISRGSVSSNPSNFYDISIRSKDVRNFSFYIFAKITLFNESFLLNSDLLKLLRYLLPFKRFFNQILNWINILYQNNNNSTARILEKMPINWHVGFQGLPFLADCAWKYL